MSTRTYAPRDRSYRATGGNRSSAGYYQRGNADPARTASDSQISWLHRLVEGKDIPAEHLASVDRLLKLLRVHEEDVRNPGDGTRMLFSVASQTIDWLKGFEWKSREGSAGKPAGKRPEHPGVPEGRYATRCRTGRNDLDFWQVDKPEEGNWAGRTFVSRLIGGQGEQRIRWDEQQAALDAIFAAGPDESARVFAQEFGECRYCHRPLSDRVSRFNGRGPDCAKMRGLTQAKPSATWHPEFKGDGSPWASKYGRSA